MGKSTLTNNIIIKNYTIQSNATSGNHFDMQRLNISGYKPYATNLTYCSIVGMTYQIQPFVSWRDGEYTLNFYSYYNWTDTLTMEFEVFFVKV